MKTAYREISQEHYGVCKVICEFVAVLLLLSSSYALAEPFAYITNASDSTVSVIDTATNTVVDTITVESGPTGVAVNPAGTRVYIANSTSNIVSVIDTATNTVVHSIAGLSYPIGVIVHPAGTQVYVTNLGSDTVSVIDTVSNIVVDTVNVGDQPFGIAINPAGTRLYVTNFTSNTVSVIDTTINAVVQTVVIDLLESPVGIAVHPAGTQVYIADSTSDEQNAKVFVMDVATDTVEAIAVDSGAANIAVNPAGTRLYVTNYSESNGTVSVIDTATNTVVDTVMVGSNPNGVSVNYEDTRVYVANTSSSTVSVMDTATHAVIDTVDVGSSPYAFGQFIQLTVPATPVDLNGSIKTSDGQDICAMVLASGQYMFSCDPIGIFSLNNLPRETDGSVKLQVYADGFHPYIATLYQSNIHHIVMTAAGSCPDYNQLPGPGSDPASAGKWIDISGKVVVGEDSQTPICAMVLANGQYMFSCAGSGNYALNVPLDSNGQVKLQVYADGFAPTILYFDEFNANNDVKMARASECQ